MADRIKGFVDAMKVQPGDRVQTPNARVRWPERWLAPGGQLFVEYGEPEKR